MQLYKITRFFCKTSRIIAQTYLYSLHIRPFDQYVLTTAVLDY